MNCKNYASIFKEFRKKSYYAAKSQGVFYEKSFSCHIRILSLKLVFFRYKLHIIKFTLFRCVFLWILTNAYSHISTIIIKTQIISIISKNSLLHLRSQFLLPSPRSFQPVFYFLSHCFARLLYKWIYTCLVSWIWLLQQILMNLKFIHLFCKHEKFALLLSSSPLFECNVLCWSVLQLIGIWVSRFWWLWIKLLWTYDYRFLYGYIFSFLSGT